jgi:hypothetical protein
MSQIRLRLRRRQVWFLGSAFGVSLVVPGGPNPALAMRMSRMETPIVRAGNAPQLSTCYIERPNQLRQNLDALCQMGKPKPKRLIDMTIDRNNDGVPDELAAAFEQIDRVNQTTSKTPAEEMAKQRRTIQTMREINERMPYGDAAKAALREMSQYWEQSITNKAGVMSEASRQRGEALDRQMNQDPIFKQVQEYSSRFQQLKYEQRRSGK